MKRRLSRQLAVQCLYQLQMSEATVDEAIEITMEEIVNENEGNLKFDSSNAETMSKEYLTTIVQGTKDNQKTIDTILEVYLKSWKMDRLSKVDRQILRLAVYEMLYSNDVPPKVVVNEAIELAKQFGTNESGKFVNGILGKLIKEIDEIKEKQKI